MTQWVILGRDGVINEPRQGGVLFPEDVQLIPGSGTAIARLNQAGIKVAVAINQSAIGRGILTQEQLHRIHEHLKMLVAKDGGEIEAFVHCPHLPESDCDCRKPRIGLLDQLEAMLGIDYAQAYVVGDRLSDIQAAQAKGCYAVLVRTGKGTRTENALLAWPKYGKNVKIFNSLADFSIQIAAS